MAILRRAVAFAALLALPTSATPTELVIPDRAENALTVREYHGLAVREYQSLEKRIDTTFSLEQTLENEPLFDGNSAFFGAVPLGVPPVTIICTRCCTKGDVKASLTLEDVIDPTLRFDLRGVQGFIELDVVAKSGHTFKVPLFRQPPTPLGVDVPKGPKFGLTFEINLIFSIAAAIDLNGGFFFKLPDDAFFEASILDGALTNVAFDGMVTKSLPLTVNGNGTSASLTVDIQLRAQVGVDATESLIPGLGKFGAQADVGVFVNIIEFVATMQSTADCAIQVDELFDLNVGAFLEADVQGAGKTFGAVPTVSTTLFQAAVGTQCLLSSGLPFPTRTSALPTAGSGCAVPTSLPTPVQPTGTAPSVLMPTTSVLEPGTPTTYRAGFFAPTSLHSSQETDKVRRALQNATSAVPPPPAGSAPAKTLTMTLCKESVINCPASLQTTVEVPQTACASATTPPATAGVCPLVTDAVTMSSTKVTGTFTPGTQTTIASVLPTGTGGGNTTVVLSSPARQATYPPGTLGNGILSPQNRTSTLSPPGTGTGTVSPAIPTGPTKSPPVTASAVRHLGVGGSFATAVVGLVVFVIFAM